MYKRQTQNVPDKRFICQGRIYSANNYIKMEIFCQCGRGRTLPDSRLSRGSFLFLRRLAGLGRGRLAPLLILILAYPLARILALSLIHI